jgi:hypothetical protein
VAPLWTHPFGKVPYHLRETSVQKLLKYKKFLEFNFREGLLYVKKSEIETI